MDKEKLDKLLEKFTKLKEYGEKIKNSILCIEAENKVSKENLKKLNKEVKDLGYDPDNIDDEIKKLSDEVIAKMNDRKKELDMLNNNIEKYYEVENGN